MVTLRFEWIKISKALFNFKDKIGMIMEAIRSMFNNFKLIANFLRLSRIDEIYSMVDKSIGITHEPFDKLRKFFIPRNYSFAHPSFKERIHLFQEFYIPEHFKFILENIDQIKGLIYTKGLLVPFDNESNDQIFMPKFVEQIFYDQKPNAGVIGMRKLLGRVSFINLLKLLR
jgi:hypothetical protein